MDYKILEHYNKARLPRKYRAVAEQIDISLFNDIVRAWETGNDNLYHATIKSIPFIAGQRNSVYYILAIWLHPLTKFQELAGKVERLTTNIESGVK